jgi:hypothetical protein
MDPDAKERSRIEGYLPKDEFRERLESALARVAFTGMKWKESEERYAEIARKIGDKPEAAEALYWQAVSRYKGANDHVALANVAEELRRRFPDSEWTTRASVWLAQPEVKVA